MFKEISSSLLEECRASESLMNHPSIDGSSAFHVMVFTPNSTKFKAADRICICDECKKSYGSCDMFSIYVIQPVTEDNDQNTSHFIVEDSYVAFVADTSSVDTLWFVKIVNTSCIGNGNDSDDYGHTIPIGTHYLKGHFMEKTAHSTKTHQTYSLSKKTTYFYKESVVYPFVQFEESKKGFKLDGNHYTEILNFVEKNNFSYF